MAPIRLAEFYSANTIKAENFLAVGAFSGVATLFWEWLLQPLTGLSLSSLSQTGLIACVIITFGCFYIALSQILRVKKHGIEHWREFVKQYDQDDVHIYHSKEIIEKTLKHYDNDQKVVAETLDISPCSVEKILSEDNYGFKDSATGLIMSNFKEYVANIDYLTKVYNRPGFENLAQEFMESTDLFTLMYIDLDKFKPINDTYGHEMGDFVLKKIASRLVEIENEDIKICRLGGDEFVVLFRNYEKSHLVNLLKFFDMMITKPISLPNGEEVTLGASFGLAEYETEAKSLVELMDLADKNMYEHKSSKK